MDKSRLREDGDGQGRLERDDATKTRSELNMLSMHSLPTQT